MKNDGVKAEPKVKKFKKSAQLTDRRTKVLKRLEVQLKKGTKVIHEGGIVPLTVKDVQRIEREIKTLKIRV